MIAAFRTRDELRAALEAANEEILDARSPEGASAKLVTLLLLKKEEDYDVDNLWSHSTSEAQDKAYIAYLQEKLEVEDIREVIDREENFQNLILEFKTHNQVDELKEEEDKARAAQAAKEKERNEAATKRQIQEEQRQTKAAAELKVTELKKTIKLKRVARIQDETQQIKDLIAQMVAANPADGNIVMFQQQFDELQKQLTEARRDLDTNGVGGSGKAAEGGGDEQAVGGGGNEGRDGDDGREEGSGEGGGPGKDER